MLLYSSFPGTNGNPEEGKKMEREVEVAMAELSSGWVEFETDAADFCDKRLNKRYANVLNQMARMPQAPINQSSESLSEMIGAYRFIDNSKVTVEKLLAPHREQISLRAGEETTVLLVQDTTYFDYDDHLKCKDLKPLKITKVNKALWLHTTLCLLPNGLPLGVVDAQFMTGNDSGTGGGSGRPIENKLSMRWLTAVDRCETLFADKVKKVWICDREADMYELLDHISAKQEDFIVRSKHLRAIEEPPFFDMRTALDRAPIEGCFTLNLKSNGSRAQRTVRMQVRYVSATVSVPRHKQHVVKSRAVTSNVVEAFEVDAPEGEEPLHWRLLTSLNIACLDDALQVLNWYQKRWGVEEMFKILKSGCRVEKAQFQTVKRLNNYITLSLIVAWRIYFLVHLNRIDPDAPVDAVLTISERETLQLLLDDKRARKKKRRVIIKTAAQAINQIAALGGYLNRRNDPHPGIVVLWRGTMALAFSTMTYLAQRRVANS